MTSPCFFPSDLQTIFDWHAVGGFCSLSSAFQRLYRFYTGPRPKLTYSSCFFTVGRSIDCTCDNPAAEWAQALQKIKEASKVLVDTRDSRGGWDLLANLFELPFFELLGNHAPHSLLAYCATGEARDPTSRQRRSLEPTSTLIEERLRRGTWRWHNAEIIFSMKNDTENMSPERKCKLEDIRLKVEE